MARLLRILLPWWLHPTSVSFFIGLALCLLHPTAAVAEELDAAVSAIVRISASRVGTQMWGTGFVVGLDHDRATIVTASHVIEGAQRLEVTFAADPSRIFTAGPVLGMEAGYQRGLATFLVRGALPSGVAALSFEADAKPQRGAEFFLLGFPQNAMTLRTLRRDLAGLEGTCLQLDIPAGAGFSGAPVLWRGKVVGVVVDEDPQFTYAVRSLVAREAALGWGATLGTPIAIPSSMPPPPQAKGGMIPPKKQNGLPSKAPAPPEPCVAGEERTVAGVRYIHICAATFNMGSSMAEAPANEKPAHRVSLGEFWISKGPVTAAQYKRAHHLPVDSMDSYAVASGAWGDAKWVCEQSGARLPTEAEWEYAARIGVLPFTPPPESPGLVDMFSSVSKGLFTGLENLARSNSAEWVADWYGPYSSMAQINPSGPATGKKRVVRSRTTASDSVSSSTWRSLSPPSDPAFFTTSRCVLGPLR